MTEIKIFGGAKESFVGMFLAFLLPLGLSGVGLSDAGSEYQWPEWAKEIGLDIPGPYEPTWESLDSHPISEWFRDAQRLYGPFLSVKQLLEDVLDHLRGGRPPRQLAGMDHQNTSLAGTGTIS